MNTKRKAERIPAAKIRNCVGIVFCFFVSFASFSLRGRAQEPVSTNLQRALPQIERRLLLPHDLRERQLVTVPPLIGRQHNRDELAAILDRYGLLLGESLPQPNNDSIGQVTSQWPGVRQRVFPQTPVNVAFAVEMPPAATPQPELIPVPRYMGMQLEQAVSRMPNDQVRPGEITEMYADFPPGTVTGQFPEPGMLVDPGAFISLNVSLGPPPERRVEVPSLVGLNIREAAGILRELVLFAGNITERDSEENEGSVLEQSPGPGTVVRENTPVDLVVSAGIARVVVPNVLEMYRDDAARVLEEARLSFVLYYEKSTRRQENTVIQQKPPPGAEVPPGTVISLVLAEKPLIPPPVFWAGAVLIAALAGGISGYRFRKTKAKKKKHLSGKTGISFHPVWEPGTQLVETGGKNLAHPAFRLKLISDKGTSAVIHKKN